MNLSGNITVGYSIEMIKTNYHGQGLSKKTGIKKFQPNRFAFNFSFLTPDRKYNLNRRSKTVTKRVRLKLIDRIYQLSQNDIVTILNYDRKQGLERIPESAVKLSIHPGFISSHRYDNCEDDYWVFRLGNVGRVIGKKNNNIFYLMSIDASFDQYHH